MTRPAHLKNRASATLAKGSCASKTIRKRTNRSKSPSAAPSFASSSVATDAVVAIPEHVIELMLVRKDVGYLAPYFPSRANELRAAKIAKHSAKEIQIQARLSTLILRDHGWKPSAIVGVVSRYHYGSTDDIHSNAVMVVYNNAKPAINRDAKRRFDELKTNPRLFTELRGELLRCQPGNGLPTKSGGSSLVGTSPGDAAVPVDAEDDEPATATAKD